MTFVIRALPDIVMEFRMGRRVMNSRMVRVLVAAVLRWFRVAFIPTMVVLCFCNQLSAQDMERAAAYCKAHPNSVYGVPGAPDSVDCSKPAANAKPSQVAIGAPRGCDKNISFAVAEGGQIVPGTPSFAQKWVAKNQKKYAGTLFFPSTRFASCELPVGILDLAVGLEWNLPNRKNQHQHEHEHDACVRQRNRH